MLTLADYLEVDVERARKQWLDLRSREFADLGARQVNFSPVETLICFALGLIAPPSKSGTINLREGDQLVQHFARLFKRTPGSLAAKLANLDGRRPHAARFEAELWVELSTRDDVFPALFATILQGAREAGLGESSVPDFLGLGDDRLTLVRDSIDVSDEELLDSLHSDGQPLRADLPTERARLGTARIGQQQFARRVLGNSGFACAFCGLSTSNHGIRSSRLLIASHIKPWRESTAQERLDPANGLAACPTHDAAFESHLLRIDRVGRILRAPELDRAIEGDPAWRRAFGPETVAERLIFASKGYLPGRAFVDWQWTRSVSIELQRGA